MMKTKAITKTGKIMVVDDEESIRRFLASFLTKNGYEASGAADGFEAIKIIGREKFDLVLLDMNMPGMDGITALGEIKTISPETAVIMITGYGTIESAAKALSMGAFYYITKPFESLEKLLESIEGALGEVQAKKEVFFSPENNAWSLVTLSEISHALNSSLDAKDLIDVFIRKVKTIFDCDYFGVLVTAIDASGRSAGEAIIETRRNFSELEVERIKHCMVRNHAAFKGETAELESINFIFKEDMLVNIEPRSVEIVSSITLPLIFSKSILGVVGMGSHKPENYSIETSRLFSTLVNQLASSLNNCLLYEGMKQYAMKDSLTSLHNFRFFKQMMEYEFSKAERFETPLSCIMMDIDNFKKLNDTRGHQAGDDVLSEIASVLTASVRKVDTLARYGGEEFVLICPHTDNTEATALAERIRREIANHYFTSEHDPLRVTLSIGVATFSSGSCMSDKNQLIKEADRLLYLAKAKGKNRVESAGGIVGPDSCEPTGQDDDESYYGIRGMRS
jgi:diguanylate cyclase (GGDEF)-like protein